MSEWSPFIGDVSVGAISGFCIGYFAKKMLRIVAFIFGAWLMSIQVLASRGIITVNYDRFVAMGDSLLIKISQIAPSFAPLGLSFCGGFALGVKKG